MAKKYMNDFLLKSTDYEIFADSMECSVAIIKRLNQITQLPFQKITADSKEFKANISCRYCGQSYNNKKVWIVLYFNNIGFTPEYKLVLAIWEGNDEENKKQQLADALKSFKSQYFKPVDERWLFINLDNYLICCDNTSVENEINRIVAKII